MTREDRQLVRESLRWLKPTQHLEIRVSDLAALLDECDRLEDLADQINARVRPPADAR